MKRIILSTLTLVICLATFAGQKVDGMDGHGWNWTEFYSAKIGNVHFENGYMILQSKTLPKGNPFNQAEYVKAVAASTVKTYAQLPIRPKDNYKLTIKYIDPNFGQGIYQILFNATKGCLEDEQCGAFFLQIAMGGQYTLPSFDGQIHMDKLPIKGGKDVPMTFVLTKKGNDATIELNGIELYNGICPLTEPCIGFAVLWKKTIKIDEVIIDQFDLEKEEDE